jgi:Leucine-rich repeat (LRR) protein
MIALLLLNLVSTELVSFEPNYDTMPLVMNLCPHLSANGTLCVTEKPSDCEIVAAQWNAFSGKANRFNDASSCCSDPSIVCDDDGKVTELHWNDMQIEAPFPEMLLRLDNLVWLDLKVNQFHGEIPSSIGELKHLQFLDLNYNRLTGTIPTSIGDLNKLERLELAHNRLSGIIPVELAKLRVNCQHIVLLGNLLSSEMDESLMFLHDKSDAMKSIFKDEIYWSLLQ